MCLPTCLDGLNNLNDKNINFKTESFGVTTCILNIFTFQWDILFKIKDLVN